MPTRTITAEELDKQLQRASRPVTLDVRNESELLEGKIPGSINLPLPYLDARAHSELPRRGTPIVVYCAHGIRSVLALKMLEQMGYADVSHLEGGFAAWKSQGLPIESALEGCKRSTDNGRYSRQLLLREVGPAGQQRLREARVLIVGVGGLGSPAALYLAGAGVGTIGLVDPDRVEISNLHRQIVHDAAHLGVPKVESARERIRGANPDVAVEPFAERFEPDSAGAIFDRGWDAVIDGADNFPTRYTLNDTAMERKIPLCHGSIDRFEGRVTTFLGHSGPCYRCLFPHPPHPGTIGSCAERGVLGVLPGVIGTLQATEAIKLVLGIGEPLSGRLLTYDALRAKFLELRYEIDPTCSSCQARDRGE